MRKFLFIGLITIFHSLSVKAIHFWQPYPIVKAIGVNGLSSRLELSVFDSLTGTWNYFNTPYFAGSIDTSKSTTAIAAFTTYTTTVTNRNKDYGFIIYDQELHTFAARILSNPDPDYPGATLFAIENAVTVHWSCCDTPNGFYSDGEGYVYDINQHQWMGGLSANSAPWESGDVHISFGGYGIKHTDDYTYSPMTDISFYHPPTSGFPWVGHLEPIAFYGNQDLLMCQSGSFLTNDEVTISIYDPWYGSWKRFTGEGCQFSGEESTFYLECPGSTTKMFGAFDDSLHKWVVDSIIYSMTTVICRDRVIAYINSANTSVIHVQTYSPNLHSWVKDSVITTNGINNLFINKSTVRWIDNSGVFNKIGYIDSVGWGNYDTPVQLFFKIINMYPSMGVPLIFARSYSYGVDSTHFYFDDGIYSEYYQHSTWHQFKVNGSYSITPFDSSEVCIETVTDSGLVVACKKILFSTCSVGGIASAADTLVCTQDSVTLILTGYTGAIQWQARNTIGGWTNITASGFNNDTLIVPVVTGSIFRAKVRNGTCPPAFSTIHKIDVVPFQLQGTISGDTSVCRGTPISFMVDSLEGFQKFIWNFPSGFSMNNDSTSVISGVGDGLSGLVSVYATTTCGITNSLSIQVQLNGPDTTVGYNLSINELASYENFADNYQWLLCPSMTEIPGETLDYFHPLVSGSYAVQVTMDGCVDTSNCHDVVLTDIQELNNMNVYVTPNPVTNMLSLQFMKMTPGNYSIKINTLIGIEIFNEDVAIDQTNFTKTINTLPLANGWYSIYITSGSYSRVLKFVKMSER